MAVTYTHDESTGKHTVSRTFDSPAAAWACARAMERIVESAYTPLPSSAPDLSPSAAALIERSDEDAPLAHLKHGEAFHGTSSDVALHALGEDAE